MDMDVDQARCHVFAARIDRLGGVAGNVGLAAPEIATWRTPLIRSEGSMT
jgi:hypothetical protein